MPAIEESETRVYAINLRKSWITPSYKRTDRAINMIREFAAKHMKTDDIKLDQDLNRQIWNRGKTNPPRKIRVKMIKDEDGSVVVSLYEESKVESVRSNSLSGKQNDSTLDLQDSESTQKDKSNK